MINESTSSYKGVVQSGVARYPIGFTFHYNGDNTPQIRVTIGDMVAVENLHFVISEDLLTIKLIPLEEEAPADPNDYSWLEKWVGMPLVIERDIPFVQESDYQTGRISSERIEKDFDLAVMRDQILAEEISKHTEDVQEEVDAINARIDDVQQEHAEDMEDVQGEISSINTRIYHIQQEYAEDMESIDDELATKATKTELENAKTTLNSGIQRNTQAIQEVRADYQAADQSIRADYQAADRNIRADMNAKDSKLETTLNDHAGRLNALRTDHDDLDDDVSDIQAKIPQSASASNPLVTKQQLLDEETDIRKDLNSGLGEVQTQITAQAAAIAKKAEKDSVYTKEQVDAKVSSVYKVKGSVANYDSLPTNANIGDVYDTLDSGANYVWTENGWDKLGDIVDLTDYAKKEELDEYLPLSGGEMTGPLTLTTQTGTGTDALIFRNSYPETAKWCSLSITRTAQLVWEFDSGGGYSLTDTSFFPMPGKESESSLGTTHFRWQKGYIRNLYAQKIFNFGSAALDVPTESGTLARVEDIAAIGGEGTTGQVLTKTDDGFAWQDSAGGGGGIANVVHDDTLIGSGTEDSPLGVKPDIIPDVSGFATKDELADKADKSDIPTVPTKVSEFENDAGYLTEHQDISGKQDKLTAGENITIVDNVISATGGGSGGEGGGLDKAYTKLMVHVPTQEEFDNEEIEIGPLGYTFALPDSMEDGEYYFYITVLDKPNIESTDEQPNYSSPINNYKDFIVDFAMANGRVRFCSVRCGERAWYDLFYWDNGLDSNVHCFNIYTCNGRQVFFTRNRFVESGLLDYNGWSGRTDTDVAAVTFSKVVNRNTKEEFVIENDEYMNYFHGYGSKNPGDFGWEESWPYRAYSIAPQSGLKDYILQDVASSFSTLTNLYTPSDYYGYMIGVANLFRDNDRFDITVGDKIKFWINNAYDSEAWVVFEIDILNKTYTQELINGGIDGINEFSVGIASNSWRRQVVFYKGDRSEKIGFGEHQVYYQIQPNFFVNDIYFDFWWEDEYINYHVDPFEFLTPVTPTDMDIVWGELSRIDNQIGDISSVLDTINGEDI